MYNFRARARATLPGAALAQVMRVRAIPAAQLASQVAASQALDILDACSGD